MKVIFLIILTFSTTLLAYPQTSAQLLSLNDCFSLAKTNSELSKNFLTLERSADLDKAIRRIENLPSVQLSGSATYQSDVFSLPIATPGTTTPNIPQNQYRLSLQLTQKLYDGGITKARKKIDRLENINEQQSLEIKFYELNSIIAELYFGVLQSTVYEQILEVKKEELISQEKRIVAGIANGVIIPSEAYVIEKALVLLEAEKTSILDLKKVQLASLSDWIGQQIGSEQLVEPNPVIEGYQLKRTELEAFSNHQKQLTVTSELVHATALPKISAFVTGGYGQPNPYNFFQTNFNSFYMIGARLEWRVFNWGEVKHKESQLELKNNLLEQEKAHLERIILNQADLLQQEIERLEGILYSDEKLIQLQEKIFNSEKNQFEQGVLTSTDYISSLNELHELKIQKKLDKLKQLHSKIRLLNLTGNL